jgi:hypothetical protein
MLKPSIFGWKKEVNLLIYFPYKHHFKKGGGENGILCKIHRTKKVFKNRD